MTARRGLPTPGSRERERESSRGRGAASQGQRQNQRETKEEREPLCYNLWFKERCAWLASSQCFRMKLSVYPIKKTTIQNPGPFTLQAAPQGQVLTPLSYVQFWAGSFPHPMHGMNLKQESEAISCCQISKQTFFFLDLNNCIASPALLLL